MRGDPRIPELAQHVEFACRRLEAGNLRGERDLVVIVGPRQPHRLLVERREADGIDTAVAAKLERVAVIRQREPAAGEARSSPLDLRGIKMTEIDKQGLSLRCAKLGAGLHALQLWRDTGNARAFIEDAPVADHDKAAVGAVLLQRHKFRRQLRADAGGISHRQGNERLCGHMITFSWLGVSAAGDAGLRSNRASCNTSGSSSSAMPAITRLVTSRFAKKIPSDPLDISIDCR